VKRGHETRRGGGGALRIPQPTIERLSTYLQCLRQLKRAQVTTASSSDIAQRTGINAAQFRKDLSYFGDLGTPGLGYDVQGLESHLTRAMGLLDPHPTVLVGIGNLGAALAAYSGFRDRGFQIVATTRNWGAKLAA
jgi:redox-sensing transcriptional repressor